ncbi:MAG TPA: NnrS family protein, partial [Pseudomonas sp.]|nr:NnrS family protein [Pseudomonas sp.]
MQLVDRKALLQIAPLWRLGFRPFFLAGTAFAALAIPLWLGVLAGWWPAWQPAGGALAWHRHEMLFGFGTAIIAGFLLTAAQNWTGRPGPSGRPLAALALLWLAARLAWLFGAPLWLLIPLELAFLPAVAVLLGRMLWAVRQVRNYPTVGVLALLTLADLLVMLGLARGNELWQRQGVIAALWLVAVMMGLIGGRVIPFFTQRGLGRPAQVPALPWLECLAQGGLVLVAVLTASGLALQPRPWLGGLFALVALAHGVRLARWHDAGLWRVPLLWSLHLAYAWLVIALAGQALWHFGLLSNASLALHALAVGSVGGLILGMVARVSLGHTGRPLQPPAAMAWAFAL